MKGEYQILSYDNEPIAILEGGYGLPDIERAAARYCHQRDIICWVLDDLYSRPERVVALKFLKPKTVIFGTTGVYDDQLNHVIAMFKIAEHIPDVVGIAMGEELGSIKDLIEWGKSINPNMKVYTITEFNDEIVAQEL